MSNFHGTINDKDGPNNVKIHSDHKYIQNFGILNFNENRDFSMETQDSEIALCILEGTCSIEVNGHEYENIKSRDNVFQGLPTSVYVPIDSKFTIKSGKAKIAICGGKCDKKKEPALIVPDQIKIMDVGKDNWNREVRIIMGPDGPSENLILGETMNPPGNWSGTPPHKHEKDNIPEESLHEELYYFRFDKPQGWGIERFYSPGRNVNELIYLQDNSVTFMPWGYHQIVAGPGYTLYYLFFLSGEGKKLVGVEDTKHSWIKD